MKCSDCGKTLTEGPIAYSEKYETFYCINCAKEHVKHALTFFIYENKNLIPLDVGLSGAGPTDIHHKFYTDDEWVFRHITCSHLVCGSDLDKVIFYCEDGKIRCSDCLYEDNIHFADPLLRDKSSTDEFGDIMWLLPFTYEPYNLDFIFECDNHGIRGEHINVEIMLKNNKKLPICDINFDVESFSADPLSENESFSYYLEKNFSRTLILKKLHFDKLEPDNKLKINFEIKIPLDGEIKENQFYGVPSKNGLNVPNELMVFARFNYKTAVGYLHKSEIEHVILKIK